MNAIIAFSNNLKLGYLSQIRQYFSDFDKVTIVTSHKLLENECLYISELFPGCKFTFFGEVLSDTENEECDRLAYDQYSPTTITEYLLILNTLKNEKIAQKIIAEQTQETVGVLLSNDLGFVKDVWLSKGFQFLAAEYHFVSKGIPPKTSNLPFGEEIHIAEQNGILYVFVGKTVRIKDYLNLPFIKSDEMRAMINGYKFITKEKCRYLVTDHEAAHYSFPPNEEIDVRIVQDGYFPPNYTSFLYKKSFYPKNVSFYSLDALGQAALKSQNERVELLPFVKKNFMPIPNFPQRISVVLIASNCTGSWSAQINRSDDDLLTEAVALLAKIFPNITFLFRCHPTCVHPEHDGTNSINRIREYFSYMGLSNVRMTLDSSFNEGEDFTLSLDNTSLLEDINRADLVISEYSHSMIEAAMEQKLFSSVNLTNRRNFFECITNMGFPHCRSVVELEILIRNIATETFRNAYIKAINNYNKMISTDVI